MKTHCVIHGLEYLQIHNPKKVGDLLLIARRDFNPAVHTHADDPHPLAKSEAPVSVSQSEPPAELPRPEDLTPAEDVDVMAVPAAESDPKPRRARR